MASGMFSLKLNDFSRGLITAVLAAGLLSAFTVLQAVVQAPNFDVFSVAWGTVLGSALNAAINAAVAAFVGYIAKNFVSDSSGKVFGRIG